MIYKLGEYQVEIAGEDFFVADTATVLGKVKLDNNANDTSTTANDHVVFSKKSDVFRAPIIWFPAPKAEESPPPFGFWTMIIKISSIQVIIINIAKSVYMIIILF